MNISARSFTVAEARLRAMMLDFGRMVSTETWQGRDIAGRPDMVTYELLNASVSVLLGEHVNLELLKQDLCPNLPWADDHFLERVSGEPLNPPPSYAWWPWGKSAGTFLKDQKFNHTYPERFWPKLAAGGRWGRADWNPEEHREAHRGIRGEYGDLTDVVNLLREQPNTRQAFFPIWFPEDTGIGDGGRKPCTLGYHFIQRGRKLHCVYFMRSCDLIRHWRDDAYLAVRLMLWVLEKLVLEKDYAWRGVTLGSLTMHMTSLHCFVNDMAELRIERDAAIAKGLS